MWNIQVGEDENCAFIPVNDDTLLQKEERTLHGPYEKKHEKNVLFTHKAGLEYAQNKPILFQIENTRRLWLWFRGYNWSSKRQSMSSLRFKNGECQKELPILCHYYLALDSTPRAWMWLSLSSMEEQHIWTKMKMATSISFTRRFCRATTCA